MPKQGYLITNPNPLNIQSTIYLIDFRGWTNSNGFLDQFTPPGSGYVDPNPPGIPIPLSWRGLYTLNQYGAYFAQNINTVYTSATNLGLSPPFNNSGIPVNTNVNVIVVDFQTDPLSLRVNARRPVTPATRVGVLGRRFVNSLVPGEVLLEVLPTNGRSHIGVLDSPDISNRNNMNVGTMYLGRASIAAGTNWIPPNSEVNTPAHEYGHILGFADRYKRLANAITPVDRGGVASLGDYPIYLPGLYDPDMSATGSFPFPFNYNTATIPPFGLVYPGGTTLANYPNGPAPNMPQTNFNRPFYDYEYNTLFGWEHNIMSRAFSANDTNVPSRFSGLCPTYDLIYGPYIGPGTITIIITTVQINIILNINSYESVLPVFQRFVLMSSYHRDTFGSYEIVKTTGLPNIKNALIPYDTDMISQGSLTTNSANLCSFIGMVVNNDWQNAGSLSNVDWTQIEMVDDGDYDFTTTFGAGLPQLGLSDVMDFRMSNYNGQRFTPSTHLDKFIYPFQDQSEEVDYGQHRVDFESGFDFENAPVIELLRSLTSGVNVVATGLNTQTWRFNEFTRNGITTRTYRPSYGFTSNLDSLPNSSSNRGIFNNNACRSLWDMNRPLSGSAARDSMNPQGYHGITYRDTGSLNSPATDNPFPAGTARGGSNIIKSNLDSAWNLPLGNLNLGPNPDYTNPAVPNTPYPIPPGNNAIVRWAGWNYKKDQIDGSENDTLRDELVCLEFYYNDGTSDFLCRVFANFLFCSDTDC